jgi:hypothetical protein
MVKQMLAMSRDVSQDAAIQLSCLLFEATLRRAQPCRLIDKPLPVVTSDAMNRMSFRHGCVSIENSREKTETG